MSYQIDNQLQLQGFRGSIQINNGMGDFGHNKDVYVESNGYIKANGFISKYNYLCRQNECAFFKNNSPIEFLLFLSFITNL